MPGARVRLGLKGGKKKKKEGEKKETNKKIQTKKKKKQGNAPNPSLYFNFFNNDFSCAVSLHRILEELLNQIKVIFCNRLDGAIKEKARKWDFAHQLDLY